MERITPCGKFPSEAPPVAATQTQGAEPGGDRERHGHHHLDSSVMVEILNFL